MKHFHNGTVLKHYIPEDGSLIDQTVIINTILTNSQDTIYFKDRQSRIILSSKAHSSLYGTDNPLDVIGKTDFDYFPEYFAKDAFAVEKRIMETEEPIVGILERLVRPDGTVMWLSASKYPLYNENGEVIGTWGTSRDVTKLKEAEDALRQVNTQLEEANRQLRAISSKDSLTGLFNHGHFLSEIKRMFDSWRNASSADDKENSYVDASNESSRIDHCLILFDLDDFKFINDTYGHLIGDFVIRHLGQILADYTKSNASSYRCGGDEFAMLVCDTTIMEAKKVAEDLRCLIEQSPFYYLEHVIPLTVSVGVSSFFEVEDVEGLIQTADSRLYVSKEKGKNKVT